MVEFGAFVEILPGTDGLLHVSEMAHHRVNNVHDEVKEGDQVLVKVVNIDPSGKIRLSRKALLEEAEGGARRRAGRAAGSGRTRARRRSRGHGGGYGGGRGPRSPAGGRGPRRTRGPRGRARGPRRRPRGRDHGRGPLAS